VGRPDRLLVRHITGGRHGPEYEALVDAGQIRRVDVVSAVNWRDYANVNAQDRLTTKGAMFMAHEGERGWVQYWQVRTLSVGRNQKTGEYAGVGPSMVRGHDLRVLDNAERFQGLVSLEAGIRSEHERPGRLPKLDISRSEEFCRDLSSRTAALRSSASSPFQRSRDRSPPQYGRGRDTRGGRDPER
jgi:hypothetical protein